MIASREAVRAAYERALALDPCTERAAHAVAQALGLTVEAVLDVVGEESEAQA